MQGVLSFYFGEKSSSLTVMGRQIAVSGWPDQAESASNELTAGVGLYRSHHTRVEGWAQAMSAVRHPLSPPYFPSPQHAFLVSSSPA